MSHSASAWPKGMKRTRPREQVLAVLEQASIPLSAEAVYRRVAEQYGNASLSSIYRVLSSFVDKGVANRTTMPGSGLIVFEINRLQHRHYAVCMGCSKIIAIDNCPMERFVPEISESGFSVEGHKVEIYGYCRDCNQK